FPRHNGRKLLKQSAPVLMDYSRHLDRCAISMRFWLGFVALSCFLVPLPAANAQSPVITISADLDILAVTEAFDPVANPPWTAKALMPTPRDDFSISDVNGIVYVAGGEVFNNCLPINTLEAYDPIANTWSTKSPMPTPRWFAGAGTI